MQAPQYSALTNERFPVPAVEADAVDPKYLKQRVRYSTPHPPGTIVVDPGAKFLYLVMEGGYAMRYGIGVGREGFGWSGAADIRRKAGGKTAKIVERSVQRSATTTTSSQKDSLRRHAARSASWFCTQTKADSRTTLARSHAPQGSLRGKTPPPGIAPQPKLHPLFRKS